MSATSARNGSFAASIACAIDAVVSAPHARYSLVKSSSAPAEHFFFYSDTREQPFQCRYCVKKYSRTDVLIRHEKTAHGDKYGARPSIWEVSAAASPTSSPIAHQFEPAAPDSPDMTHWRSSTDPIQHALTVQDFTTLHAEAHSASYLIPLSSMQTQTPLPACGQEKLPYATPAATEFTGWSSPRVEDADWLGMEVEVRKFHDLGWKENPSLMPCVGLNTRLEGNEMAEHEAEDGRGDSNELLGSLGPMFDPLWHPLITRRAAVTGYMLDRHHDALHRAGLLNT
ncbi:uncharacterized protein BO88DRAFT_452284 [Aspergillus vadensis CBS 113365]|uniref:C2H2-type domain-containing protein n=1 Tax=Aspergillus vadensis (strain CBS 113365 / IMI 142717 / IBT 24658) TaxID=1448311 RepID=A0A319CR50_ASPVC|nr:hypothetical protein BO88DRAFT_452284 [Aspergillus vadensis CBS 113365]PYH70762.1 hypothetical protein BO88DRAFT_452284 [Aspergillus vadensis CBS 113365]